jgi:hypothetical protein
LRDGRVGVEERAAVRERVGRHVDDAHEAEVRGHGWRSWHAATRGPVGGMRLARRHGVLTSVSAWLARGTPKTHPVKPCSARRAPRT